MAKSRDKGKTPIEKKKCTNIEYTKSKQTIKAKLNNKEKKVKNKALPRIHVWAINNICHCAT